MTAAAAFDSFGGFDGGFGGDEPATVEVDPVTAAWLDIDLIAPDGAVTSLRSEVFDRIGVVGRSGGPTGPAVVEPLTVVGTEYAALETMWQVGLLLGESRAEGPTVDSSLDIVTVDGLSGSHRCPASDVPITSARPRWRQPLDPWCCLPAWDR